MDTKTVWIFNPNRRIYPPAPPGKLLPSKGPIYREHWVEHKVTGETRFSFITESGAKVPKKGGLGFALSKQEVDDNIWRHDHKYQLSKMVGDLRDVSLLKKIALLIGYKEDQQ